MINCSGCGKIVSDYLMCDEIEGEWCGDCFEPNTHCAEKHGEGCVTNVMVAIETESVPSHKAKEVSEAEK